MSLLFSRHQRTSSDFSSDPHTWALPDSFRSWGFSARNPTTIPSSSILRDVHIPYMEVSRDRSAPALVQYPTAGQMTVHLCMLECFRNFRRKIESANAFDELAPPSYSSSIQTNKTVGTEKPDFSDAADKWDIAVRIAITRFRVWYEKIDGILRHASFYNRLGTTSHSRGAFTKDYLPPLDVLYVWYSYMNLPSFYRSDNLSQSKSLLLDVCMPWDALMEIIDRDTMEYKLPEPAQKLFSTLTSQSADLTKYLESPPVYSNVEETKTVSVDLEEAVHLQREFVDQMHELLWLRSPAFDGTLQRALAKYSTLSEAMSTNSEGWLEAVLMNPDLKLVWRTHLLYPAAYQSFCERAFQNPIPVDSRILEKDSKKSDTGASGINEECLCWICERIRNDDPHYSRPPKKTSEKSFLPSPPSLNKVQLESIKADVGFYRYVEFFRVSHPPGTTLPTRAPTKAEVGQQKAEQEKKDRAGVYYGLGWTVEIIQPAVFDSNGKLLKPEKTKVRRSKNLSPTGGLSAMLLI